MRCPGCGATMHGPRRYWFECRACGLLASNLVPSIGSPESGAAIDERGRGEALEELRRANFEQVLDVLDRLRPSRRLTLLDVGCAHGWFLDAARRRGHEVAGIEPDDRVASVARAHGHRVRGGLFPAALELGERFDVITFHDVFEHLPDPRGAVAACHGHLHDRGLLVLNLPSSQGVLFRVARLLERARIPGPLDRMWQRGFPSPHLTYFHPDVACAVITAGGFREVHRGTLPSLTRTNLWERIRYDRSMSRAAAAVVWLGLVVAGGVIARLPADISLQVFERRAYDS